MPEVLRHRARIFGLCLAGLGVYMAAGFLILRAC